MPAGRPSKISSVEELEEKVNDYFENCPTKDVTVGDAVVGVPVPTITGLALHLGFESRQSFYDYESKPEFAYAIKRARLMVENEYEMALQVSRSPTGAIFALKNMGWSDKQEIAHSGDVGITFNMNFQPSETD
jgi:hypothetical protein